jgi:hypothetical protein
MTRSHPGVPNCVSLKKTIEGNRPPAGPRAPWHGSGRRARASPIGTKAVLMLRGSVSVIESHHRVHLLDEAVSAAVKLSQRFISRELLLRTLDGRGIRRVTVGVVEREFRYGFE